MLARSQIFLALLLAASSFARTALADHIIYVNASAAGANNGTTWSDAYLDLQDALDEAAIECIDMLCEIWVAAGTYKPDRGTGDVLMVFDLPSGISLYGGFGGWEERREERDVDLYSTILDGDLLGNDEYLLDPKSTCCFSTTEPGCDNQDCMQLVDTYPSSTIDECPEFWHFGCVAAALDLCGELCRPTRADNSVGLVTVINAPGVLLDGFTLQNADGYCDQVKANCTGYGGLYVNDTLGLTVRNCRFTKNRSRDSQGAAAIIHTGCEVEFHHCSFTNNGRGFLHEPIVGMRNNRFTESIFRDCNFVDNDGTALHYSGSGHIERCNFLSNTRAALAIKEGSPVVSDCDFIDHGDFDTVKTGDSTTIVNCRFLGNGGNYALSAEGTDTVINCLFAGNAGGGIRVFLGSLQLVNCVVYGNGDLGVRAAGPSYIIDSILWGNTDVDDKLPVDRTQILALSTDPQPILLYNAIEGWSGAMGGTGNVGLDPMFVDVDGVDEVFGTIDDNFRLSPDSLLINLGHPNPPLVPHLDDDGHPRILCGRVDMGAYEFGIGDYNCDRVVDLIDFANFPACLTGPAPQEPYQLDCAAYDFATEINEDVDLLDFASLQRRGFDVP